MRQLTLILSPEASDVLSRLAEKRGGIVSAGEVIRRALGTELFIVEQMEAGSRILVEDSKKNVRELRLSESASQGTGEAG